MSTLREVLLANVEATNSAYRAGLEEGRRIGFNEGLAEARRIFENAFPGGEFRRDQHDPLPALLQKQAG